MANKESTVLSVRMSRQERAAWEDLAKSMKLRPSTLARTVLVDLAERRQGRRQAEAVK